MKLHPQQIYNFRQISVIVLTSTLLSFFLYFFSDIHVLLLPQHVAYNPSKSKVYLKGQIVVEVQSTVPGYKPKPRNVGQV